MSKTILYYFVIIVYSKNFIYFVIMVYSKNFIIKAIKNIYLKKNDISLCSRESCESFVFSLLVPSIIAAFSRIYRLPSSFYSRQRCRNSCYTLFDFCSASGDSVPDFLLFVCNPRGPIRFSSALPRFPPLFLLLHRHSQTFTRRCPFVSETVSCPISKKTLL